MELVSALKFVPLRRFICPVTRTVEAPLAENEKTQWIHLVDSAKPKRVQLVLRMINELLMCPTGVVVLFDLGHLLWRHIDPVERVVMVRDVGSFTQLLRSLNTVPECIDEPDQPLLGVVVDNLSVFHWDLISEGTLTEEYTSLASQLARIQQEYNCVIVTTSLDKPFETGIGRHASRPAKEPYSEWSSIPPAFLNAPEQVIYLPARRGKDTEPLTLRRTPKAHCSG